MKRFLALFAVMAIVMSMFSGIALAAEKKVYVQVDNDQLAYGEGFNTVELSGKIFDSSSNALEKIDAEINIYKDIDGDGVLEIGDTEDDDTDNTDGNPATPVATVTAENGVFSVLINTDSVETGVANYLVVGTDDSGNTYDFEVDGVVADAMDSFVIVYETELASPETFEWTYPVSGQQVVQGVFVNEDADKNNDVITIAYQDAPTVAVATANFHDEKSFGFLFNGSVLDHVGEIGVYVNGVLAVKGEVKAGDLDVTVAPNEVPKALGNQEVTFDFDLADKYVNGDEMASGYTINLLIEDKDENTKLNTSIADAADNSSFTNDKDQKVEVSLVCDGWATGTYKATLTLETATTVVDKAEVEFRVVDPSKYNLMSWSLDSANLGEIKIGMPNNGTEAFPAGTDQNVDVQKYDGSSASISTFVEVIVEGCGVDETFVNYGADADADDIASVTPSETGTMSITVNVYTDADDNTADYTVTKEVEVTGWNVEVTPSSVIVNSEEDITFVVTDENGNPVNNAVISIGGTTVVDAAGVNIIGGVYIYEVDEAVLEFDTVGEYDVAVSAPDADGNALTVTLTDGFEVLGAEVYTVTTDTPVMLNGLEEEIYVTVLDENGDVVYPTFEAVYVDADGDKDTNQIDPVVGSRKDLDGDGVKEAVKLTIKPTVGDVELIIRATTDGGEKKGEVSIELQKPQVVHTKATKLTENFETEFEFTVVDPRDNSVMDDAVTVVNNYFPATGGSFAPTTEGALTADGDDVWTATYLAKDIDWEQAEKDEETVAVKVMMNGVKLETIEVVEPSLTADPENVIINAATNITLTYADGNGNALEGYEVKLGTEVLGETDENGQVVYAASSTSSLSLEFNAETDVTGEETELKVKSTADTVAPVATVEVSGNSAVIKITDNVRVSKVLVNGAPVDIFFPMPEVTHIAPLADTFKVQAIDINNNYSETTLTVEIEAPAVTFTIGEATEYGAPELVEGTTMAPVRFAEELGAVVDWNNESQTVTYTIGETAISMTIGSTTAVVDGENVQLTAAAYKNELGRTMVPLRMIAQELGFSVEWTSNDAPISIVK